MKIILVVVLIIAIMYLANPTTDDFASWIRGEIMKEAQGFELIIGARLTESLIKLATTRDDYLICSVYTLSIPGEQTRFIGFFKRLFFRLG